jgi:hydroxymethylpyrimidine/phosphomethylpyrimidine kinase
MATTMPQRPCVLVFAGHDPSGGAGIQADIEAIAAQGAHALSVITALTVQDNDHVYALEAVAHSLILQQAQCLLDKIRVTAIKVGIAGNAENARAIAVLIQQLRTQNPRLPVVVDTVLGSGHGDRLSVDDAVAAIQPLLKVATLLTPNLPELQRLVPHAAQPSSQVTILMQMTAADVLLKGGHAAAALVDNFWYSHAGGEQRWQWPRLSGEFHGSGCTLASAGAGQLALGHSMQQALHQAQIYTQQSLQRAYAIADGQFIPGR